MRIDPSKLSEPLAHVLSTSAADAAGGQKATQAAAPANDLDNVERLDQMLLRRLRANATSDAADTVVSFQDAQVRIQQLQEAMARDLAAVRTAQGQPDPSRVRGLLDG